MICRFGSFSFDDHEAMPTFFGEVTLYNDRARPQIKRRRMVWEGEIVKTSATLINDRIAQIRNAFAVDGGEAVVTQSDGTPTHFLLSAGSLSGVRVVERPSFSLQDGQAHFATGLPFRVVLEADYQYNDADPLVSYAETITQIGNSGPRRVVVEVDSGFPIIQTVSTNTPSIVIQSGEAIGSLSYPTPNGPVAIGALDLPDGYQVSRGTPRLAGNVWVDWPVRWSYRMTLPVVTQAPNPLLR